MPDVAVRFSEVKPPPKPRIRPAYNPSETPLGPKVDPLVSGGPYELPGKPGHFSYRTVSFRYPRSWELVSSGGHHGLVGNSLWSAPIGVSEHDRVLIQAYYFPWEYSNRQLRRNAGQVVENVVSAQDGRILRRPSPVETGGVTVFWSDFASPTPAGRDSLTRGFYFTWNDVEYYFACQEALDSKAGIIRGCDQIFSTLRLGTPA